MGCDIHFAIQVFKNGKWKTCDIKTGIGWRSYGYFHFLGGVRPCIQVVDDIGYIASPVYKKGCNHHLISPFAGRGYPEGFDLNELDEDYDDEEFYRTNCHSPSHCTLLELTEYDWEKQVIYRFSSPNPIKIELSGFYEEVQALAVLTHKQGLKPENIRLVYCFDN